MSKLFSSGWFNGRDLLMNADKGGNSGAGASDDGDDIDDMEDQDLDDESGEGEEDGDEDGEGDGEGDDLSDLDKPVFSKRAVSKIVAGRISDVKKQFANHSKYQEAVNWMGGILGTTDIDTIHANLKILYTNHMAKNQNMTPQGFTAQQQQFQETNRNLQDTKRRAIESEFDNSFKKQAGFEDSELFRDQIIDLAENGFSLAQAYWAVMGEMKVDKKASAAARNAEQLAQHKASQKKSKRVTPGSTGSQSGGKKKIDPSVEARAKKIGMDPELYDAWSGPVSFDDAMAMLGKNKK